MKRIFALLLLCLPCGCGSVIGYYPTEEEVAAIQRGESPRSNKSSPAKKEPEVKRDRDQTGGLESPEGKRTSSGAGEVTPEETSSTGPTRAKVLRWVDCGLVIVEAEGKRERVRMPGVEVPRDFVEAQDALNAARTDFPTGTNISLSYPQKSADGKFVTYRNKEGDLLANIKQVP